MKKLLIFLEDENMAYNFFKRIKDKKENIIFSSLSFLDNAFIFDTETGELKQAQEKNGK